jgi:hypothetical protein
MKEGPQIGIFGDKTTHDSWAVQRAHQPKGVANGPWAGSAELPLAPFEPIFDAKTSRVILRAVQVELAPRDPKNRLYTPI